MDIPGKLREDLKRIYGANDPLNYIEDIMVEATDLRAEEKMLTVKLRVPARMDKYVASTSFGCVPPDMLDAMLYGTHGLGNWKIPEPVIKVETATIMEAMNFLKPKKIIYSGPKTIVFWPDGTKTIVSLMEGQEHDDYTAYCAAVVKKMFGATHKAKKFLETVAVHPEPKPEKVKEVPIEVEEVPIEVEEAPVEVEEAPEPESVQTGDKYANLETIPMPGTEDPDWGRKHWCPDAPVPVEEDICDAKR